MTPSNAGLATANPASANPYRGEAMLTVAGSPRLLRPSFAALVERAGAGL